MCPKIDRYLAIAASLEKKYLLIWFVIACNHIVCLCLKMEKRLRDEC